MTPEKGTLAYGAWNALVHSLETTENDVIVVITDEQTQEIANAFYEQAQELGAQAHVETLTQRPAKGIPAHIQELLKKATVSILAITKYPGEVPFRSAVRKLATANGAKHAHSPGINKDLLLTSLQVDIQEANALCNELYDRLEQAATIHITSKQGTDLYVTINPDWNWINSDWSYTKNRMWHNIPAGEVFTTPYDMRGTYVVDGVLGDAFQAYGLLENTPLTYRIENNEVQTVSCANTNLQQEVFTYIHADPNGKKMGEIGFGALRTKLVGVMLQDEKLLGTIHLAHGANYASLTGAPKRENTTHCDGVLLHPTVMITRKNGTTDLLIQDGEYQKLRIT